MPVRSRPLAAALSGCILALGAFMAPGGPATGVTPRRLPPARATAGATPGRPSPDLAAPGVVGLGHLAPGVVAPGVVAPGSAAPDRLAPGGVAGGVTVGFSGAVGVPGAVTSGRPVRAAAVALTVDARSLWPTTSAVLTATAGADVGPTPYFIQIYDDRAGTRVAACGVGSTCTAVVREDHVAQHWYRAFVAAWSTVEPPPAVRAASGTVPVAWKPIVARLATPRSTVAHGAPVTLTARSSADIGPTPFFNYVIDQTAGQILARCPAGNTCTATTSQAGGATHSYAAVVAGYAEAVPPPAVQAESAPSFVTWTDSGFQVRLSNGPGTHTITATSSDDVGWTSYYLQIYAVSAGRGATRLGMCGSGTVCNISALTGPGAHYYVAFVASGPNRLPPADVQASSATIEVPAGALPGTFSRPGPARCRSGHATTAGRRDPGRPGSACPAAGARSP